MRLPAPKEKKPVTFRMIAALAVPFLWSLIYLTDQVVIFLHCQMSLIFELLFFATAFAFVLAFIFSPRDDVVSWKQVSEPRQRLIFFGSAGVAAAGIVLLWLSGAGFWAYANLALAVLTLLWLILPYWVLAGNLSALNLLLSSMRAGMAWWTAIFLIFLIKDGTKEIMNNHFPVTALAVLGITYWWFLITANRLISIDQDQWPQLTSGWALRYWLGIVIAGSFIFLWILTGFTNNGEGWYGGSPYQLSFPFYDVAALLEPLAFSDGNLLLLHAIPWQKILLLGSISGDPNPRIVLSGLHWLGLLCLFAAVLGVFAAFSARIKARFLQLYAVFACVLSAAMFFQIVAVWRQFSALPESVSACLLSTDVLLTMECIEAMQKENNHFMLMGQHIPSLFCAFFIMAAAVFLFVRSRKS